MYAVERQRRRLQVLRMIADDVVVILEMLEHFVVAAFAVPELEAVLDFDRIAGPVERRSPCASSGPRLPLNMLRMILCFGS